MLATSRATATFCWLPPDSALASVLGSPPRTSYSFSSSRARSFIPPIDSTPWFEIGGWRYSRSARFSASVKSSTRPHSWRSSGMCATPASVASRTPSPVTSSPAIDTRPDSGTTTPAIACTSSSWPLPSTPAMATTSPPRTVSDTPFTASSPRWSRTCRSSTSSIGSPSLAVFFSTRSSTSRPTISRARLSSVAPSVGTVSIFSPRRSTVTRSEISSTSFSLWLMKTIETPSSFSARSTSNSSCVSCAVSTAVGSSRIRMRASR